MPISEEERSERFEELANLAKAHIDAALKSRTCHQITELLNANEKIHEAIRLLIPAEETESGWDKKRPQPSPGPPVDPESICPHCHGGKLGDHPLLRGGKFVSFGACFGPNEGEKFRRWDAAFRPLGQLTEEDNRELRRAFALCNCYSPGNTHATDCAVNDSFLAWAEKYATRRRPQR